MNNPNLLSSFADEGTREEVPQNLQQVGYTPTNPNIQGYQLNEMLFQLFGYLNFLKKKGLSAYSTDEDYVAYNETTGIEADIVRDGNKIYFAKQDNGKASPKAPATNPEYWGLFFDFSKPIYTELAKYALKNGSASNLFKVKDAENDDEAVSLLQMTNAINAVASSDTFMKPNKGVLFEKVSPSAIQIPAGFKVVVNNQLVTTSSAYSLDLNSELDTGSKTAGKDYYVYAKADGTFYLSANNAIAEDRLIGGFHYGLTPENEVRPVNALKTEADMVTSRGIKAYSMWDLTFKPKNKRPEGKVLVNNLFWRDIYPADEDYAIRGYSSCFALDGTTPAKLAGGAETNGRKFPKVPLSKGGDGTINYGSLTWYDANEIVSEVGMRMISYDEFSNSSYGVVEQKSLQELGYETGTGVIQHYPELESKWGVEMSVGVQYYWGGQIMNGYGSTDFAHRTGLTHGRGSLYTTSNSPVATRLGGYELGTSTAYVSGSRHLFLFTYVWYTHWVNGFVAVCDHMNLDK